MSGSNRLLDPHLIPETLWDAGHSHQEGDKSGALRLPAHLATTYEGLISRHGLASLAASRSPDDDGPVGGVSLEETNIHFAQAFDGSCARSQFALLDPHNDVPRASNSLVRSLSGNRIAVTDAPCGCGAGTFSLLSTIADLREQGVLPRQPLDVSLLLAEISGHARAYALELLSELKPRWEEQAITVTEHSVEWDVTDEKSNMDLIREISRLAPGRDKKLLLIANFSGFLIKEKAYNGAKKQISELLRWCSGDNSYAIWIEPNMGIAFSQSGLFTRVRQIISGLLSFAREDRDEDSPPDAIARTMTRFYLPLQNPDTVRVGLSVMPIDLQIK